LPPDQPLLAERRLPRATGTCAVTVNATPRSHFSTTPTPVTLSVTKTGSGSAGHQRAGRINCGSTCAQSVMPGSARTLTATPAIGSTFAGWTGACSGTARARSR